MEHAEQVELITVLETVFVVLQGIATVAVISVPSLFYIAAHEAGSASPDYDPESTESSVTAVLTFIDVFLVFLLISQIIVVSSLKAGLAEKNSRQLRPWLIYSFLLYTIGMGVTIVTIILAASSWELYIANFFLLMYKAWALIQVLLFYHELIAREPLNSGDAEQGKGPGAEVNL